MTLWVTAKQAAWYLSTNVAHVYVLAHRDHWRTRKRGRTVEYALDDVDDTREARLDEPPTCM